MDGALERALYRLAAAVSVDLKNKDYGRTS